MLIEQPDFPAYKTQQVGNDFIDTYDTPQGACMARIYSTDLSAYLKKENTPGSIYKART
ncbi:MAG: hypothetical protein LBV27_00965 [Oscillospiraceae bacterium]|jgi:hypothetical protein|nr:hypothetical protein [Oscillospiraceae bacterium]